MLSVDFTADSADKIPFLSMEEQFSAESLLKPCDDGSNS